MPVSVRLSELTPVSPSDLTDDDLFLITDSGSTSSKKVTLGQVKANIFSGQSVAAFDDVDITSTPPTDGQFLMWSDAAGQFVPGDISLSSLGELNDVDITSTPPTDKQVLSWDAGNQRFIPQTIDLSAIYNLLGVIEGSSDLGNFPHEWQLDNVNIRTAIVDIADALSSETTARSMGLTTEAVDRTAAINDLKTLLETADTQIRSDFGVADNTLDQKITDLTTIVNNLDIDISPETLNSINELATALQDNPNIISSLQTKDSQLEGQITSLSASTATDQGTQDARLNQLEADVLALGQSGAPTQLDTINELATTLAKLVPLPPTTIAGLPLTITTNAGTARLCVGFTDRTGGTSGYNAGDSIKRNTDGRISTNKINDIGPGDSGDIVVKMSQNSYDVSTNLAEGIQSVDFMGLRDY